MPTIMYIDFIWTVSGNDLDMSVDFDLSIENYCISRQIKFTQQHFTGF